MPVNSTLHAAGLLFGVAALCVGAWWLGVQRVQGEVTASAQRLLAQLGADFAQVTASGQRLRVSGEAPDPSAEILVNSKLRALACQTWAGVVNCGVQVDNAMTIAPPPPPPSAYPLRLVRQAGVLKVNGRVPTQATEEWLASRAFQGLGQVQVAVQVAAGRSYGDLQALARQMGLVAALLPEARLDVVDRSLNVTGTAPDAQTRERARSLAEALPAPFALGRFDVLRDDEFVSCEQQMNAIVADRPIAFVLFGSELKQRSKAGLRKLGSLLGECPGMIRVEGHTDNVGEPEDNVRLSLERAQVVATALAAEGLSPTRMRAVGLGESKPIADNHTRAGRTINRRIELRLERPSLEVND